MQRAFVLQLSAECVLGVMFTGKVEHIRSGEVLRFNGVDELLSFLVRSVASEKLIEEKELADDVQP
jgi:hypothetical protein